MAPIEGALTLDVVLDELRRLVAAAIAEEDTGIASYETVQSRVDGLSLHALTYIRFLENHGYISYDRAADRIAVSEAGRAAIDNPSVWQVQAQSAFAEQLDGSYSPDETEQNPLERSLSSDVDSILDSIADLDVDLALDEMSSEASDISMTQMSSGRLSSPDTGTVPVLESEKEPAESTQPSVPAPTKTKREKLTAPAPPDAEASSNAGKGMSQQDYSSRRLGTGAAASASARPAGSSGADKLYEREDALGSGGMGTVYRARQVKLDRLIALKEIKEIFDVFAGVQRSDIVERFTQIVQTQSRLLHPNIIQIIDLDTDAQFPFVVMQYAPNGNLRRLINTPQRPPLQIALKYFLQVLHALNTSHDNGVTHGGIKPENIVLDHAGNALVTDFGISGVAELDANRGANQVYVGVGTVAYMSPEQFRDPNSSSVKSDIYSLGIMFYEMLTGKVPGRRSPMPSSFFPDIPRALDDVFDRMSMDDADERYESIEQILADIYASEEVMAILDKRGGFLFLRDPMTHGATGLTDEDDDDLGGEPSAPAATSHISEASVASEAEDEPTGADEDLDLPDAGDDDVLGKLDKYGELFDGDGEDSSSDEDESQDDD